MNSWSVSSRRANPVSIFVSSRAKANAVPLFHEGGVGGGANAVEPRVNAIEPRVDGVEPRVNAIKPRVDGVKPRVNAVDPPFNAIEPPVNAVEPRIQRRGQQVQLVVDGANVVPEVFHLPFGWRVYHRPVQWQVACRVGMWICGDGSSLRARHVAKTAAPRPRARWSFCVLGEGGAGAPLVERTGQHVGDLLRTLVLDLPPL